MWCIKTHGETYYVEHVDASMPWSTKQTPDNPSTKGSIKFKNCYCSIDEDNVALIRPLTDIDKARIRAKQKGHTRIIFSAHWHTKVTDFFKTHGIKIAPIKRIAGSCGSSYYLTDILKQAEATFTLLSLKSELRILKENEVYWKAYDDDGLRNSLDADIYDDDM